MSGNDLGNAGQALWDAIHERDVSSAHKSFVLHACRIADNLDRISADLSKQGFTSRNSRGDEVANPLLVEHRQQLNVLRQALHALGVRELPVSESGKPNLQDELAKARAVREAKQA